VAGPTGEPIPSANAVRIGANDARHREHLMAPARQLTSSASLKSKEVAKPTPRQSEAPRRASDASFESKKLNKINNVGCKCDFLTVESGAVCFQLQPVPRAKIENMRQADRDFVQVISRELAEFAADFHDKMSGGKADYLRLLSARAIAEVAIENNDAACGIMSQINLLGGCQIDLFERGYS
jgi:hypothetical protein